MNTVTFKSNPQFFFKEREGTKPNTFRKDDPNDRRFQALDSKRQPRFVRIRNSANRQHFTRRITDISYYDGWWIISWEHPRRPVK